jgi:hypothetical protein
MKSTAFIALALFLIVLSFSVSASMLEIKEVTVKVNGERESAADESGGTIKVPPSSTLSMKVKIINNYDTSVDGGKIKNIAVEAILEGIDDGDDLDVDANDFDLLAGRDKTVTLDFNIPLKLETDATYKLTLTVEGKDENSTKHTDSVEFDVDADKLSHELRFVTKELLPARVTCSNSSKLTVKLVNTGENDETVDLTIDASQIGYTRTLQFDMPEDIDDDDNEYEFSDYLRMANPAAGIYPVQIRASYYGGKKSLDETLNLQIDACSATAVTPTPTPQPEEEETVPVTKPTQPVVQPVTQPVEVVSQPVRTTYSNAAVATPRTSYSQTSWFEQNKWLAIILLTDLVLVIVGIIVIVAVMKRRQ